MGRLELANDVLDAQLVSRRDEKIGRVDSLLLELRQGRPPRVSAILMGGPVRAEREGRPFVWLSRALRAVLRIRCSGVTRLEFAKVLRIAECVRVDAEERDIEAEYVEHWLASHVVCRMPGAGGDQK